MLRLFTRSQSMSFPANSNRKPQEPSLQLPSFSHFPLHSSLEQYLEARDLHTPTFIQYALLTKLHSTPANAD